MTILPLKYGILYVYGVCNSRTNFLCQWQNKERVVIYNFMSVTEQRACHNNIIIIILQHSLCPVTTDKKWVLELRTLNTYRVP